MQKIKIHNIFQKDGDTPMVLGLGFFDCVHLGHKKLLTEVIRRAKELGCAPSALTFSTNPGTKSHSGVQVYSFPERICAMENLGIENIVYAKFDATLRELSGEQFLDILTSNFNVSEVIAGPDFRFGKGARCDVLDLSKYLANKNISTNIVDFYYVGRQKLSSGNIRDLICEGEIERANQLLSEPYFFLSPIKSQRGRGRKLGFPTANMQENYVRTMPKEGVYATSVEFDGVRYKSVTNVGGKPTFSDNEFAVESYILDFSGDLYGKQVKLIFWKRLRDIAAFDNPDRLKNRIESDINIRREMKTND